MKKATVFIDGSAGTTGLRIHERLADRADLTVITLPDAVRKDTEGVRKVEEVQQTKDRSRIVVLPTTLVISMPSRNGTTRMERRSHIFAVRDEVITDTGISRGTKLNQWYFIDGNTDVNTLRTFFPDLPLYLKLPASGDRTL
jgi:hypothetical protein